MVLRSGGKSRWLVTECPPMKEKDRFKVIIVSEENTTKCGRENGWKALKLWRLSFNGRHLRVLYFGEGKKMLCFLFLFLRFENCKILMGCLWQILFHRITAGLSFVSHRTK